MTHLEDLLDSRNRLKRLRDGLLTMSARHAPDLEGQLSRDSHRAPEVARRSIEFLKAACQKTPVVSSVTR